MSFAISGASIINRSLMDDDLFATASFHKL